MKCHIPYVYPANVQFKRKSKPENVWFFDHVEFEIAELAAVDNPVAVRWREHGGDRARPVEVRFGDRGFQRLAGRLSLGQLDAANVGRVDIFDFAELLGIEVGSSEWHELSRKSASRDPSLAAENVKTWNSSGRDDRRERAEALARRLAVIDGEVWVTCHQPVVMHDVVPMETRGLGLSEVSIRTCPTAYGAPLDFTSQRRVQGPYLTRFFRIDQLGAARDRALSGRIAPTINVSGEPEILMPEVFDFSPDEELAERTLCMVIDEFKPVIGGYDDVTMEAWMELRRHRGNFRETRDGDILSEAMERAIPAFMARVGSDMPNVAAGVEAAMGDWSPGDVRIDFWPAPGR